MLVHSKLYSLVFAIHCVM